MIKLHLLEKKICSHFLFYVFIKCCFPFRYVSILNDFVESEFFVIDGDSLLLRYLCDREPYLTFVYSVECYLNNFMKKGAKFVVVFFKV